MERFIPSSNDLSVSGDSGGGEGSGERFLPATLLTEQLQVDEGKQHKLIFVGGVESRVI